MKIFYFRKNAIIWAIALAVVIIGLIIFIRMVGAQPEPSPSTLMVAEIQQIKFGDLRY